MNEEVLHKGPLVVHDMGHANHEHPKQTFITKYIFSQDHKMISRQFLITGIIWAFIGGLFLGSISLTIRVSLTKLFHFLKIS